MQHFGGNVSVIYHDNYYKAHHGMSFEERTKLNYDHPDAFDTELLIEDLKKLRRGETIHSPTYDYDPRPCGKDRNSQASRVIIVEGLLIFQSQSCATLWTSRYMSIQTPTCAYCAGSCATCVIAAGALKAL